jgi:phospholipid-transporting ATPase
MIDLQDTNVNFGTFIIRVFTYLVAYSHLIPISLYVALEILKLLEGNLIKKDSDMYWPELDKWANVRSSDLVEELGQVEFIFSDKTGTLTKNEMEFKKCSVNFEVYGECNDEVVSKTNFSLSIETKTRFDHQRRQHSL